MMKQQDNRKTVLITGASSGIGAAFVKCFADAGMRLVLVSRNRAAMESLVDTLSPDARSGVIIHPCDLGDMQQVDGLIGYLRGEQIGVDYLVNNAGFGDYAPFHQADYSKLEQMIDLNIKALSRLTWHLIRPMVGKGYGKVLNVASVAAFQPGPGMAVYFATKAYVLSLGEALHTELKGTGVTVTTLCPGPVRTGFMDVAGISGLSFFDHSGIPTAEEVARFGFKAMMRGRMTVIHSLKFKLLVFSNRVAPRSIVARLTGIILKRSS